MNDPSEYTKEYTEHCEILHSLRLMCEKWKAINLAMIGMIKVADNDMRQRVVGGESRLSQCIGDLENFIEGYK